MSGQLSSLSLAQGDGSEGAEVSPEVLAAAVQGSTMQPAQDQGSTTSSPSKRSWAGEWASPSVPFVPVSKVQAEPGICCRGRAVFVHLFCYSSRALQHNLASAGMNSSCIWEICMWSLGQCSAAQASQLRARVV